MNIIENLDMANSYEYHLGIFESEQISLKYKLSNIIFLINKYNIGILDVLSLFSAHLHLHFFFEYIKNPYKIHKFFQVFMQENYKDSWLTLPILELQKENKPIFTGILAFDLNNFIINEIFSKKLFILSKKIPAFFEKLGNFFTLGLSLGTSAKNFTVLKKIGDLYYLFYKCYHFNEKSLMDDWKIFLLSMMQNSENYEFFNEINQLIVLPFSEICQKQEIIIKIFSKKTKKILYFYLNSQPLNSFRELENFKICLGSEDLPFYTIFVMNMKATNGKIIDKYLKLLKKESHQLCFMKLSIILLKMFYVLFTKETEVLTKNQFTFSLHLMFWRLIKILLFYHNGNFSILILNFLAFSFDNLFIKNLEFSKNFIINIFFLLCSFVLTFEHQTKGENQKDLFLLSKQKSLFLIEKLLEHFEQSRKFFEENFYLEIVFKSMSNLSSHSYVFPERKQTENLKLITLLDENCLFTERIVVILSFLKESLKKVYINRDFYSPREKNLFFQSLLKLSNLKDFKYLSMKEKSMNNNLLHFEKSFLLLECFGIIGMTSSASEEMSNAQNHDHDLYFDKSLSALDLAKKIYVQKYI